MEHRDVDHEPDAGSGQHAEKYSAHRIDFFVHVFPPHTQFLAGGPVAQWAIRKEQEKRARSSVFARCQVVKLSQSHEGSLKLRSDWKPASVRWIPASAVARAWYRA